MAATATERRRHPYCRRIQHAAVRPRAGSAGGRRQLQLRLDQRHHRADRRLRAETLTCTAGEQRAASTLHASLSGNALMLDCQGVGEAKTVDTKMRFAWLSQYGAVVQQELASARTKSIYTIKEITLTQ